MKKGCLKPDDDVMGMALVNYQKGKGSATLLVHCNKAEDEVYDLDYFFRSYDEMPETEKVALDLVKGKTLDVGAGTGVHALALQQKNVNVTAIDVSEHAINLAKKEGVKNAVCANFYELSGEKFDTLLFLMNGIGLVENLDGFDEFFAKCDELLEPDGQIIFDSSDLIYLYEEEDGSVLINLNDAYYGEVIFQVEYEGEKGEPFPWLFIDFGNLQAIARKHGFQAELIYEDEHYNYLARLSRFSPEETE